MTSLTIGRNPASSLVVSDAFPRVSNDHATIELSDDGRLIFRDHSSNGTVINGRLIHREDVPLTNGDHILLAGEYLVAWPVLLNFFPELQRRTMRFDANGMMPQSPSGGSQQPPKQEPQEQYTQIWHPAGGRQGGPAPHAPQFGAHGGTQREAAPYGNAPQQPPFHGGTQREAIPAGGTQHQGYAPGRSSSSEAGQLNSLTQSDIDEQMGKFSTGAFLGTWAWALSNRIYWPLAIIPLSLIPYLGQVLSLFLCTYLGLNGNQLGWQHSSGVPFPVWRKRQKQWIWIGALVFLVCAAVQLFAFTVLTNF